MATTLRSRIAPTPSGYLHIGNAFNFLLTEAITQKDSGILRLRIDDLDTSRVRPEYVLDIFDSLVWLDIKPAEGPTDAQQHEALYSQERRLSAYNSLLTQLTNTGLVFACNCSRKELQHHSNDRQYPGTCMHKGLDLHTPNVSWRISTPVQASMIVFIDHIKGAQYINLWDLQRHFVVRRRDGLPAYQLASLCDDVTYGINTIVRGVDLLPSTAAQLYLAGILGLSAFSAVTFYHHPLLMDQQGDKLSKSAGSTSLRSIRQSGVSSGKLREQAAAWYEPLLS
jgi:glutamyl/glutaminyl-tRNA synthetase